MSIREKNIKGFNVDCSAWMRELIPQTYGSCSLFPVVFLPVGAGVSAGEEGPSLRVADGQADFGPSTRDLYCSVYP